MTSNTLPSGNDPSQIGKLGSWNWGAFFFGWIWAGSNTNGSVQAVVLLFSIIPYVNIITHIVMGLIGNNLTWKYRHYESVDEFKAVQKKWGNAIRFIIYPFLAFILFAAFADA